MTTLVIENMISAEKRWDLKVEQEGTLSRETGQEIEGLKE